jgi:hypothetical protein
MVLLDHRNRAICSWNLIKVGLAHLWPCLVSFLPYFWPRNAKAHPNGLGFVRRFSNARLCAATFALRQRFSKMRPHAAFQKKAATNPSLHPSRSIACPPESIPPLILLPSRAIPALLSPRAVCSTANRTSPTSSVDDACEVLPLSLCPYLSAAFAPHEVSFFNQFLQVWSFHVQIWARCGLSWMQRAGEGKRRRGFVLWQSKCSREKESVFISIDLCWRM